MMFSKKFSLLKSFLAPAAMLLFLAACTGTPASSSSAGLSEPSSSGAPSSSAVSSQSASQPASSSQPTSTPVGPQQLTAAEMDELWTRLSADVWIPVDKEVWDSYEGGFGRAVYDFRLSETYSLLQYSAYGSGASGWEFNGASLEVDTYAITSFEESGEMSQYECPPGTGCVYNFSFSSDGNMTLSVARPARYITLKALENESEALYTMRLCTPEEEALLASQPDSPTFLRLENGDEIVCAYSSTPTVYRQVSEEELAQLLNE